MDRVAHIAAEVAALLLLPFALVIAFIACVWAGGVELARVPRAPTGPCNGGFEQ